MSSPSSPTRQPPLGQALILLMSVATGVAVASNYYAQPLLQTIADQFGLSLTDAGTIVTAAQLGYGLGLFLLLPLGDLLEQRRLIVGMILLSGVGLVISGLATGLPWLLLGTAMTGLFSVAAQIMVPLAATLSAPEQRGRAVGTLMSGLLLGILLARTVAGAISSIADWRTVYLLAAALMLITALALARSLPRYQQNAGLHYGQLLRSALRLFAEEPLLRKRSLMGFLVFANFSLFWTPLAFLLSAPPYDYSDAVIGLFGLAGAFGALAASLAGRLADRGRSRLAAMLGLGGMLGSWLVLAFAPASLIALIAGILILDFALQLLHVSNQSAIFKLRPEVRNRLNSGYMTCYFTGGALGSITAASLFQHYGWTGITCAGLTLSLLALLVGWKELLPVGPSNT
ncbi:MFS transporter [Corticimicrobacter populi]|uniref:MFS transporter n=1 Tax=Corticimicrobacter populi TaxID=2175229 RepID=A0A2V1JWB5_9BURK|nr:MFS transporter [Corticimicrobacter populi]PWF22625.1 MFS transporter [Corticimicrobacter populi]